MKFHLLDVVLRVHVGHGNADRYFVDSNPLHYSNRTTFPQRYN